LATKLLGRMDSQLLEESLMVFAWSGVNQEIERSVNHWKSLTPGRAILSVNVVPVELKRGGRQQKWRSFTTENSV